MIDLAEAVKRLTAERFTEEFHGHDLFRQTVRKNFVRIAFITACLEPGRDGVGDYSRTLARHCADQGHDCSLLALNDHAAGTDVSGDVHEMRVTGALHWREKIARAEEFLNARRPDWISLQFVLYGWNPRGLITGLDRCLKKVIGERRLHVMLHELWIGNHKKASIKERLIGGAQKYCLLNLLAQLKPDVVHTSIPHYVDLLERSKVSARKLPLFGNIPVEPDVDCAWMYAELQRAGIPITEETRGKYWIAGLFGSLHPNWPPEPLLTRLRATAREMNRRLVIVSIGRMGPGGELWRRLSELHGTEVTFIALGERPTSSISSFLQSIDFGIAGTPFTIIEKSGSATAMLEHGCPVIVNWIDPHEVRREAHDSLLHELNSNLDFRDLKRRSPNPRLPAVTQQFLQSLSKTPTEIPQFSHEEHPVHTAR